MEKTKTPEGEGFLMAILAECPLCHKKQAVKNRLCDCGADLVKLKKSGKVRYWIQYRLPGGRQRKEYAGTTVEEARASEGKRLAQRHESPRVLKKVPEDRMTFQELTNFIMTTEKSPTLTAENSPTLVKVFYWVLGRDRCRGRGETEGARRATVVSPLPRETQQYRLFSS